MIYWQDQKHPKVQFYLTVSDLPSVCYDGQRYVYAVLFDRVAKVGVTYDPQSRMTQHMARRAVAHGQNMVACVIRKDTKSNVGHAEFLIRGLLRHSRNNPGNEWLAPEMFPLAAYMVTHPECETAPFAGVLLQAVRLSEQLHALLRQSEAA